MLNCLLTCMVIVVYFHGIYVDLFHVYPYAYPKVIIYNHHSIQYLQMNFV